MPDHDIGSPSGKASMSSPGDKLQLIDRGRRPLLQVFARRGHSSEVAQALGLPTTPGRAARCPLGLGLPLGPHVWAMVEADGTYDTLATVRGRLEGIGYVSDQRHANVVLGITGVGATTLLAKTCSLDLERGARHTDFCARSHVGGIAVLIHLADDAPCFDLYCPAGYADALRQRLVHDGRELTLVDVVPRHLE